MINDETLGPKMVKVFPQILEFFDKYLIETQKSQKFSYL